MTVFDSPSSRAVLIGAKPVDQLQENSGPLRSCWTLTTIAQLDAVSRPPVEYPGRSLDGQKKKKGTIPFSPGLTVTDIFKAVTDKLSLCEQDVVLMDRDTSRLSIARHAAMLFLAHGVAATSGKDIAAAAGVSERTVWRHFRTKESCVEPLLSQSASRFTEHMLRWSRLISIEDHMSEVFTLDRSEDEVSDGILIVRLIAILPQEPDLQATWLMATHLAERGLIEIISNRLDRSPDDFDIRLCAATVSAALRVVDEDISLAAIRRAEVFTLSDVVSRMAGAIRSASTLPFCDSLPLGRANPAALNQAQSKP